MEVHVVGQMKEMWTVDVPPQHTLVVVEEEFAVVALPRMSAGFELGPVSVVDLVVQTPDKMWNLCWSHSH